MIVDLDEAAVAESKVFTEELVRLLADDPPVYTVPPEVSRQARREGRSILPPPVFLPQARDLVDPGALGRAAPAGPGARGRSGGRLPPPPRRRLGLRML